MAAKKSYMLGSAPKLTVAFSNPDTGAAVDPSVVTLKVQDPSGNVSTFIYGTDVEVIKSSVGNYYMRQTLDEGGTWEWTYKGVTSDDAIVVLGELLCTDPGF